MLIFFKHLSLSMLTILMLMKKRVHLILRTIFVYRRLLVAASLVKIIFSGIVNTHMRMWQIFLQKQPPEVFCKKSVLRNFTKFTEIHLCQRLFFNKVAGLRSLIRKETLAQVFSCKFCEISKKNFFTEDLRTTTASVSTSSLPSSRDFT